MNLLPWLLRWPPRPAVVVAVLLVTLVTAGTLAAFGGTPVDPADRSVAVEDIDVTVRLNDEAAAPPGGNGTVQTCLASGTPGNSVSVLGDVTVDVPADRRDNLRDEQWVVAVGLGGRADTSRTALDRTGRTTVDVFRLLAADGTLSVGDDVDVPVRVLADGSVVANDTATVTVENGSRSYDCDSSPG